MVPKSDDEAELRENVPLQLVNIKEKKRKKHSHHSAQLH